MYNKGESKCSSQEFIDTGYMLCKSPLEKETCLIRVIIKNGGL